MPRRVWNRDSAAGIEAVASKLGVPKSELKLNEIEFRDAWSVLFDMSDKASFQEKVSPFDKHRGVTIETTELTHGKFKFCVNITANVPARDDCTVEGPPPGSR